MPCRSPLSDLELFPLLLVFRDIARRLEYGSVSMNSIGDTIGIKKDKLRRILDRLDDHFGCNLVVRSDRTASENRLTPEGRELAERLSDVMSVFSWKPCLERPIRIVVSQTLFTADILTRVLKKLHNQYDVKIEVELRSVLNFRRIVTELVDGLDLAIVWGVGDRLQSVPSGVDFKPIGPKIDVVIIAHSPSLISDAIRKDGNDWIWVESAF